MRKTIWIINEYAGSPYHGMQLRHYYLGKELLKFGDNVWIISASFSHTRLKQPSSLYEVIDGLNYLWLKVNKYSHAHDRKRVLKWFFFLYKTFFKLPIHLVDKPSAILISSPSPFPVVSAYKWAKYFNARLLFEVRDIWPLTLVEVGRYSPKHPFVRIMKWIEKFAYKKANNIISVLPFFHEYLEKQGIDPSKFVHIPNGICPNELKNLEAISLNSIYRFIPSDKFIIAYAGTFSFSNALDILVEAASLLKYNKKIHFVLIGKGSEEKKLRKKSANLTNITFVPYQPREKALALIKRIADVCYKGSRKNGLYQFGISPIKLFDYMYVAKPIIHSYSGRGDLVKEANCGISVEAENPEALVKGILTLFNMSENRRKELGKKGYNFLMENYTYEKLARRLIKVVS